MCTTVREFFLGMQMILNPNMVLENLNIDIHHMHRRNRFFAVDPQETPIQHMVVIVRNPVDRLISTFFDKHVMKRQWRYLTLHHYRKFRVWMDTHALPHTFSTYLLFLREHHCVDIHDFPMMHQMPFHLFPGADTEIHAFSMEDPQWAKKYQTVLEQILCERRVSPKQRKEILERFHHEVSTKKRNAIPRTPVTLDADAVHKTTTWWLRHGFPSNKAFFQSMNPSFKDAIQTFYREDSTFYRNVLSWNGRTTNKIDVPSIPNIWTDQFNRIVSRKQG